MKTFTIGNYLVFNKRIGKGAFSRVYKGYHIKRPNNIVAIKQIEHDNITKLATNIKREIDVMKNLNHMYILKLYDVVYDYDNNNIYLILEYCAKGDMTSFLNNRPLKEKYVKKYMYQLSEGLKYLYKHKIIHRDLKLSNILISDTNDIKISDFGFARYFDSDTMVETLCGTPLYMAPEIMKYKNYTIKADLWSIGIIMYQMLVGKPPYNAKTFYQLVKMIDKYKPQLPNGLFVSPECSDLLFSLLVKEPIHRITWENFFNHIWIKNYISESMMIENNLIDIDFNKSLPKINTFKKKSKIYNENNIIHNEFDNCMFEFSDDNLNSNSFENNTSNDTYDNQNSIRNIISSPINNQNSITNTISSPIPIYDTNSTNPYSQDGDYIVIHSSHRHRSDPQHNNNLTRFSSSLQNYFSKSLDYIKKSFNSLTK